MQFKGDSGKFRMALLLAGFFPQSEGSIFNDNTKDHKRRRLKLWFADPVFAASQEQQKVLEGYLKAFFGGRILSMYFIKSPTWYHGGESLCIQLQG